MNCAITNMTFYEPNTMMPWNKKRAVHLYRRMSLGANVDTILSALSQNPLDLVDQLILEVEQAPLSPEPAFANKKMSDYGLAVLESTLEKDAFARDWMLELQQDGLRGRMALFWHNHFVTRFDVYLSASYLWQYHRLIQTYALGNFKDFVREVGLTPAMLVFLK